jgi:hypothetical protein
MTNPTTYPVVVSGGFFYWQTTGGQCRAVYVNGVQYVAAWQTMTGHMSRGMPSGLRR